MNYYNTRYLLSYNIIIDSFCSGSVPKNYKLIACSGNNAFINTLPINFLRQYIIK